MAKGDKELSHEEVWDDSALIDSWNSALDEYKKYHSIQAKGGSLEDLEEAVRDSSEKNSKAKATLEMAEPEPEPEVESPPTAPTVAPGVAATAGPAPPPQALLGSMQDEGLKRLLMSWYYAGYYTGIYEGQQHAQQKNQQSSEK